ncbi:E3 ubiquitin-protein ligase UHRF2 [Bagarius yarrelli]|uniref:E3 ubiquitin-protein ligase UHRF n=1 Tax=Bagarius yarrelli TaxID=175774 RepID=A0A556TWW1_BAGYA|nr:E3 ubiquitin-protein ligase UHRF2 [Bagarius yarrelli]
MWIQVRTIDGTETRTVEDLSRLTKIESLRLKIQEIFNVDPERQRLFYRGKQMEDGQTLFDYNVGLNDIVQLLIRSHTDPADSPSPTSNNGEVIADNDTPPSSSSTTPTATIVTTATTETTVSPATVSDNSGSTSESRPSTSASADLVSPGIGVYKINELVDCRDVSIGAWFEATIEKVTRSNKGSKSKAETAASSTSKAGRNGKRVNGKVEVESDTSVTVLLNSNSEQPSTSQTDVEDPGKDDVSYHIKYEDYPENGVVEMNAEDVRPRARTLLRFEQLEVGQVVMVNYNLELPEERGFWYDAEITTLNHISRTKKEVHVRILLGGPTDVINDCKLLFLDEIYQIEKPGAPSLSATNGQFKRKSGPECKHCKGDPDAECRFCSCCVCGGKQDAHMQLLCDECNMAFHLYCLNPPLSTIPEDEDWYCPTCKNDTTEVGMACVGRTKECTIVPSNHYGPVPGIPVGTTWKFRVQVSEAGVHRPHVGGIHGRSNDGSYSLVLAGGFEDEVDRGDEFTYTGSGGRDLSGNKRIGEHSFDQTLTHMNRALALNCDAPLNDKDGAESRNWRAGKPVRVIRSSKGRRISKYAPEEGNRYDGIYKVVKYWPEIGKCGFLVWRYLLRRDDVEPAPWTPEGLERSKKLGLKVQYPPGYLEAMANKSRKEASVRGGRSGAPRGKRHGGRGRPRCGRPPKRVKEEEEVEKEGEEPAEHEEGKTQRNGEKETQKDTVCKKQQEPKAKRLKEVEAFVLSEQQSLLIQEDHGNKKLWDEALGFLSEGPNFLRKVEQIFMCVCCQELAYQPVTTPCQHNVCKSCLHRSFRAEVFTCPACRYDLGKEYIMVLNKNLQQLLDQFFPGYSKGR